ncbi:hypothetical protein C8R44DRAFT_652734 [Mycena epipterygia]|nr:hypothetical protein C8R44DRAFT_652734 [Mycena epipterygia]
MDSLHLDSAPSYQPAYVSTSTEPFHPTVQDLISAREVLLSFCPLELVYIILEIAEYWVRVNAGRDDSNTLYSSTNNGILCYVVTPPIWELDPREEVRFKLMRVEYTIASHDQGWCSDTNLQGTYHGYTWFEAAILRPTRPESESLSRRAVDPPGDMLAAVRDAGFVEVNATGESTRWMVQKNFTASRETRQHCVTWNADSTAVPGNNELGSGDGAGFVERLMGGDRIAVIARALYPGWSNSVERAHVSVCYGLV